MSNILTMVRRAVIARAESISADEGYLTNIGGAVKSGWLNEVLETKGLPETLCVIQRGKGRAPVKGPQLLTYPGFMLIGLVRASLNEYEDALDAVELDLLKAFEPPPAGAPIPRWLPKGVTGITLGESEAFPPSKGNPYAGVLIPAYIHTII